MVGIKGKSGVYKRTKEHNQKISLSMRRNQNGKGNKGKTLTEKTKKKISLALMGNKHSLGNKNNWKGDKAGKVALHIWLAKNKPKSKLCEKCNDKRKLSLSNIRNHQYTRNPNDYKWLCYSCHKKYDLQIK